MNTEFPSSKVVCHSKAPNGEELITLEIELHRFILPEGNTHRSLSRNYQSSRAVPVLKQLEQICNDPAMPVYYGSEQRGMAAGEELTGVELELAKMIILGMRDACLNGVKQLQKLGLHKQISNRYVEPWMKTKGVVTATREAFEAMFLLRCHKDAQPEFKLLAERMRASIEASKPQELKYGEYHLPYIHLVQDAYTASYCEYYNNADHDIKYDIENAIKVSTSCNAQVSYRVLDDSLEKALKIYDMLNLPENGVYKEDPPHFSPTEHIAKVVEDYNHDSLMGGNFVSCTFWQYRKALEIGHEDKFINN